MLRPLRSITITNYFPHPVPHPTSPWRHVPVSHVPCLAIVSSPSSPSLPKTTLRRASPSPRTLSLSLILIICQVSPRTPLPLPRASWLLCFFVLLPCPWPSLPSTRRSAESYPAPFVDDASSPSPYIFPASKSFPQCFQPLPRDLRCTPHPPPTRPPVSLRRRRCRCVCAIPRGTLRISTCYLPWCIRTS